MLDELSAYADAAKINELISRLEHKATNTALAAEAELSVLWAISRVAQIAVEPNLPDSGHRPDASSANLLASSPAIIEVRALSDDSFSGKEAMDRTANIIAGFADHLRKGAGQHLYFRFSERSSWHKHFHRERCIDPKFQLTPEVKQRLKEWIMAEDWPTPQEIRIREGKTDVTISWHTTTSPHFRVSCSMPPVAYHLEDNPIYKALRKKARQFKGAALDNLRCVFLVDAGCDLLRKLRPVGGVWEIGGDTIIWHALQKLNIDLVCVFSPRRRSQFGLHTESYIHWQVTCFDQREGIPSKEYERLEKLARQLPPPRFEAYQARDLHKQDGFNPTKRGWYLATTTTDHRSGKVSIKISSRLVLEYLAGRMDAATFRSWAFGDDRNDFEAALIRGCTIQNVRFEGAGIDEDDDYLIFDLDFDWGAGPLKPAARTRD